jgi:Glycosyl transferase family 90
MQVFTAERDPEFHGNLLLWKAGGELHVLDLRGFLSRHEAVLSLVADADAAYDIPDFAPVRVFTRDQPTNPGDPGWRTLAFSTAEGYEDIAVPDFLFGGFPEVGFYDYDQTAADAAAAGRVPPVCARLGWIGNCANHPVRTRLLELGAAHPELLDIHHVDWVERPGQVELATAVGNDLSLVDQVLRWGLLIDVEGVGWSTRMKLLLHSGRPVFIQERPWREYFWAGMRPMEHFIPVAADLSDLVERVIWAREHPEEAAAIGRAGQAFAQRHLARADAVRAWAKILSRVAGEPPLPYGPPALRQRIDPLLHRVGAP